MKIVKLVAENVKKLRAVEITPDGALVQITGRNGQGKTSVLDAIWWALAGTGNIQARPVRKGQAKARIRLEMGELNVERRFTEKGTTSLEVTSADGAAYKSPQTMLDALLGSLSFDPLKFMGMAPRDQLNELRRVVKLEVDIEKLDGLNRADFDRRTALNRDAKAKRAQAEAMVIIDGLPDEPIDEQALIDRLANASGHNTDIEQRKQRRAAGLEQVRAFNVELLGITRQIAELEAKAKGIEGQRDLLQTRLNDAPPLPEPIDVADLRNELNSAQIANRGIARRGEKQRVLSEVTALEDQAQQLTEIMQGREDTKAKAIGAAEMPVDGLGFGEGCVTFSGLPLEQASSAEQLRISLSIAMASNAGLKVIRIQHGNDLDKESMSVLAAMAEASGHQVWIERVDDSGTVGITIEDGAVVAVNGERSER